MKKIILSSFLALSLLLMSTTSVLADDEVRNLQIDTKAKGFSQTTWVDDLRASNIIFAPTNKFQIQVKISNKGNRNQTNVRVTTEVPSTVTIDVPDFTVNQIVANQDFTKELTVTVKDKTFVYKELKPNTIKFNMTSDVKSTGSDSITFYTGNGAKVVAPAATPSATLPKTGAATNILFGTVIALIAGYGALKLRNFARGY